MLKAPKGRVSGLADALGRELRNLPVEAPSPGTGDALVRKLKAVARIMRAKEGAKTRRRKDQKF
jgi:hypothetical protein